MFDLSKALPQLRTVTFIGGGKEMAIVVSCPYLKKLDLSDISKSVWFSKIDCPLLEELVLPISSLGIGPGGVGLLGDPIDSHFLINPYHTSYMRHNLLYSVRVLHTIPLSPALLKRFVHPVEGLWKNLHSKYIAPTEVNVSSSFKVNFVVGRND